jgi:transposase
MGKRVLLTLSAEDRVSLELIIGRGDNWRQRERAQTLILLDDGLSSDEVAAIVQVHVRTVGSTRTAWFADGIDSLADLARSGAPKKLEPVDLKRLVAMAGEEPLTAKALLARHTENGGTLVHVSTLTAALKAAGLVWKRTRHSLKKKE